MGFIIVEARVAQSAERSAVNRKVGGSNPPVSDFLFFPQIISIMSALENVGRRQVGGRKWEKGVE